MIYLRINAYNTRVIKEVEKLVEVEVEKIVTVVEVKYPDGFQEEMEEFFLRPHTHHTKIRYRVFSFYMFIL